MALISFRECACAVRRSCQHGSGGVLSMRGTAAMASAAAHDHSPADVLGIYIFLPVAKL